jgi:hypothetical protein
VTRASDLGPGGRLVAACLGVVWIGAGLAALAIGLRLRPGVLPVVLGALAVGYGWLWVEVVRTGRRRPWPFRRR